ncbi:hypothetical protein PVAP13_9NG282600 [Panicum virgatum]|uniref:AP2/ERF domain-containing protein n=1 Tax=Panicum virgatum TaxID=38727 RepID=A0A8T0MG94_PANVG|nr:hypothetical protein PVAP13_9NG282600 [Panicum virgatum]
MGPNPSLRQLAASAAEVALTASEPPPQPRARVVRILVHDADATDSSSSEDEAAAAAYDTANLRLRGASAPTNFPSARYALSLPPEPAKPIISLTPEPRKVITLPPVPVKPTVPLQVKEGGNYDGQVEGGCSELKAFAPKPIWEMIPVKRKKRSGCGNGSCLRIAIRAASVCVEEVGGA